MIRGRLTGEILFDDEGHTNLPNLIAEYTRAMELDGIERRVLRETHNPRKPRP